MDTSSNNTKSTAIEVKDVSHYYGKNQALKNISFNIPQGATVGLIGPDGVGKSTLLSLIAGIKVIQQGQIKVLNKDMSIKRARQLNSDAIAFMPQGLGHNLYPTLSIDENIDFHARLYQLPKKEKKQKIDRLLKATGLEPFRTRAAGKLSGGMKQKLSLCCALVHDPDVLILDEPTTGVDPLSRRQFWDLVNALMQELPNMTVIVATAYIEEAEQFEYLLAMDTATLLCAAPTQEVLKDNDSKTLEEAYIKLLPEQSQKEDSLFKNKPSFDFNTNETPVIEAHNLTKKFGDFTAVDKVNFKIQPGEIFGFLGSNGCGKSTTMKMLTGLIEASEGSAKILGQTIDSEDINTRMQVGYMSQSFSLYEELTVKQNLVLHARLYRLTGKAGKKAVKTSLEQFDLTQHADSKPSALSLGIRQRLQLAAACLHKPKILILDEPTSGVDPAARDMFWEHLIHLSRHEKITIFVSTHFMNEASWCDRISFMHQGKVLAMGTPDELNQAQNTSDLEEAFINYLKQADDSFVAANATGELESQQQTTKTKRHQSAILSTIWTFAVREAKELMRDPVRLLFACFGPICLVLTASWGISFDIKNINIAVLNQDQSPISHELVDHFTASSYFNLVQELSSEEDVSEALKSGQVRVVLDIPSDFSKNLIQNYTPELGFYVDGSIPFIAENIKGFITGMSVDYASNLAQEQGIIISSQEDLIQARYFYNQDFNSVNTITPSMIMMAMMLIPVVLTALGVVREKEIGSISNLYASPARVPEFLIGKQLPYILLSFLSYLILVALAIVIIQVPVKGSFLAMALGAILLISATTALGLLISCFVKSQVAAIFGSAIVALIPALNFSGMLSPISSLSGSGYIFSYLFPASWFQKVSIGGFVKGLTWSDYLGIYLALIGFTIVYVTLASVFLKKQEV